MSAHESNSAAGVDLVHANFPYIPSEEWDALNRLSGLIGAPAVAHLLRYGAAEEQRSAAQGFLSHEQAVSSEREMTRAQAEVDRLRNAYAQSQSQSQPRRATLKINPSKYSGTEAEPLLRWFVEMDAAISGRDLADEELRVTFAMSCLAGRAKTWAFGRRMADAMCFPNYETFKHELQLAFEPPKNEFRSRSEFLELRQGSLDLHAYVQKCRYLVSSIVMEPVDMATQVTTFMKGLKDGPVKTYLFRLYPETLEQAISFAMQEDFSARQARAHSGRTPRASSGDGPTPMDVDVMDTNLKCHRCGREGHFARECRATQPQGGDRNRSQRGRGGRGGRSSRGGRGDTRRVSFRSPSRGNGRDQ